MYIQDNFKSFLKESFQQVQFIDNKAFAWKDKQLSMLELDSDELSGFSVDRKELQTVLNVLDKGELNLHENEIFVKQGTKIKKIATSKINDFTKEHLLAHFHEAVKELPFEKFYERYTTALKFISNDETRYFMNGIYLDVDGAIVATDGRKMIVYNADEELAIDVGVIIPKVKNRKYKQIFIHDTGVVFVDVNDIHYYAEFIKGLFPNYKRLMNGTDGYDYVLLDKKSIESLKVLEKFANNQTYDTSLTNVGLSCHDYTDSINIDSNNKAVFNLRVNVNMLNLVIDTVNFEFDNVKRLYFDDEKPLILQDKEKLVMMSTMKKDY